MDKRCFALTKRGGLCRGLKYSGTSHQLCYSHYKRDLLPLKSLAQVLVKKGKTFDGGIWELLATYISGNVVGECPGLRITWTGMLLYRYDGTFTTLLNPKSYRVRVRMCGQRFRKDNAWPPPKKCESCYFASDAIFGANLCVSIIDRDDESIIEENARRTYMDWGQEGRGLFHLEKLREWIEKNREWCEKNRENFL